MDQSRVNHVVFLPAYTNLGLSINGLVTDGNTKICCCGFILVLFPRTTANKLDSEQNLFYKKLFLDCEVEILEVTVNKIEVSSSFQGW